MRTTVFLLGLIALVGAVVWMLVSGRHDAPKDGTPASVKDALTVSPTAPPLAGGDGAAGLVSNVTPADVSGRTTNREEFVENRIAELMELAMNDDANSLSTILTELTNPDRKIRKAALEAAVQFGDRTITPRLQELAAMTSDAEEKTELLAAVDYLNLPTLTEHLAEHASRNTNRVRTNLPARNTVHTNRSGWPGFPSKSAVPSVSNP